MGLARVDRERRTEETIYFVQDKVAYNINYYGRTQSFDADDADAVWQIRRVTTDGTVTRTIYANDGKYNCKWSDRRSLFTVPEPSPTADPVQTVTQSGLHIAGRISLVDIDSTSWTPVPAVALTNRNALSIFNNSNVEIKLNYSDTTVGYVGVPLAANNQRFYDITDAIVIYAKAQAGTATILIEELS